MDEEFPSCDSGSVPAGESASGTMEEKIPGCSSAFGTVDRRARDERRDVGGWFA